jgi:L-arabinokinase
MIAFYISGHGFGHASRQVEIINRLGAFGPILIRSAVSPLLLKRTVRVPYELLAGACDTGIVQTTSIGHDDETTVTEARAFYTNFDARIARELAILQGRQVRLIVSDIAPLALAVANALAVPGIAIANFTWDWIYETHPGFLPAGADVIELIRSCYRKTTLALELPFAGGFDVFPVVEQLPLVARRPTRTRRDTRAFFDLPSTGKVALLSFGGYGLPALDLSALDCGREWTIVTTDSVSGSQDIPGYVRAVQESAFLASGFRYEDLVAAVDVVVTKPGYGIIAECIAAQTAMVYTSRGVFREANVLTDALPRYVRSRFISQHDLFAGRWHDALQGVLSQLDPPERLAVDGAEVAASKLAAFLD